MTARPYAADDYGAIRAGMERLRVEREAAAVVDTLVDFIIACEPGVQPIYWSAQGDPFDWPTDEAEGLRIEGCRT